MKPQLPTVSESNSHHTPLQRIHNDFSSYSLLAAPMAHQPSMSNSHSGHSDSSHSRTMLVRASSVRSDESEVIGRQWTNTTDHSQISMTDSARTYGRLQSLTAGHSPAASHISHSDAGTVVVRSSMQMDEAQMGLL